MARTKWMRLLVGDLADVIRWASQQDARRIDDFRYRVVRGRESVSFRLVPHYAIEVGTSDIVVICHVRRRRWRHLPGSGLVAALRRATNRRAATATADGAAPVASGEVAALPWVRAPSLSTP